MKQQRFCYRTPKFPRHGFIGNMLFKGKVAATATFSISTVYTSTSEFCLDMIRLTKSWTPEVRDYISDTALLIPLVFLKKIPLKKEFWENPTIETPMAERQRHFSKAIQYYTFYNVLCTPHRFTRGYTQLSAAFPFLKDCSNKIIDQFMYSSHFPVHEAANAAALYSCLRPYEINWKTNNRIHEQR